MSSIGEKIKEVFTGHSHHDTHNASNVKTPDVDAPGAYPTDKTAHKDEVLSRPNRANSAHKHTDSGIDIERPRHDPEVDAKQATSAAGNYPYWGDLPQEGENVHSNTGDHHTGQGHHPHRDIGLASGAKAGDAGHVHSGHTAPRDGNTSHQTHRTVGMSQHEVPDRTRDTVSAPNPSNTPHASNRNQSGHDKSELAAATGVGALGAGYLASHHKHPHKEDDAGHKHSSLGHTSAPSGLDRDSSRHTGQLGSSSGPVGTTSTVTPADHDHHKRNEGLAAGAGVIGLGAGSHMALKKHDEQFLPQDRPTTSFGTGHAARETTTLTGVAQPAHDSGIHNRGGVHNTIIGAGSAEHPQEHTSSHPSTAGQHHVGPTSLDEQRYEPKDDSAHSSGHHHDRHGLGTAAGLGAGAGALAAAEHKHHHNHDGKTHDAGEGRPFANKVDDEYRGMHSSPTAPTHSQSSQPAHAAASQAWNKREQSSDHDSDRSKHGAATAGAVGLGAAGAMAAYYGQGKEHEQSPRSDFSERVAERAIAPDGGVQAPSSQGYTSNPSGVSSSAQHGSQMPGSGTHSSGMPASAAAGGIGMGEDSSHGMHSKVLHKCHQCGADNDISDYFKKDAKFRLGA